MAVVYPYVCSIGLYCTIYLCYTGFATRDDVMPIQLRTAATHDAIIIASSYSSCYVIAARAPLIY